MNTDKENDHKNAVLIRFRDKENALKYFKGYNGQIQDTDLISLCNFDDPHSLKAELEKARELIEKLVKLDSQVIHIIEKIYMRINWFQERETTLEKAKEFLKGKE